MNFHRLQPMEEGKYYPYLLRKFYVEKLRTPSREG